MDRFTNCFLLPVFDCFFPKVNEIQDLQINSHINFPELELITVSSILDFMDLNSGTQPMSRLKLPSFHNSNNFIIFRYIDYALP